MPKDTVINVFFLFILMNRTQSVCWLRKRFLPEVWCTN